MNKITTTTELKNSLAAKANTTPDKLSAADLNLIKMMSAAGWVTETKPTTK